MAINVASAINQWKWLMAVYSNEIMTNESSNQLMA
jgi:hypothetical protein